MTLDRMAGNASFSPDKLCVTHETPTATQISACVCNGCGGPFRPKRSWQKQCSQRCRQRGYVQRQPTRTELYYGA
jgi:hypothetical protein